jgi:hypothetical protein
MRCKSRLGALRNVSTATAAATELRPSSSARMMMRSLSLPNSRWLIWPLILSRTTSSQIALIGFCPT